MPVPETSLIPMQFDIGSSGRSQCSYLAAFGYVFQETMHVALQHGSFFSEGPGVAACCLATWVITMKGTCQGVQETPQVALQRGSLL